MRADAGVEKEGNAGERVGGSLVQFPGVREAAWVALGQVGSAAGLLVGTRLITGVVPPGVFGVVSLFLAFIALASSIAIAPVLQAGLRLYPEMDGGGRPQDVRSVVRRLVRRNAALLSLAVLVAGGLWVLASPATHYLVFPMLAILLCVDAFRSVETVFLSAARQQRPLAIWSVADAWARPALAVGGVTLAGATPHAVLGGYVLGAALVSGVLGARTLRFWGGGGVPSGADSDLRREVRVYAMPLAPLALAEWLKSLGDRYLVAILAGLPETGVYSAAYGLANRPFLMLYSVVELTVRPAYFESVSSKDSRMAWKLLRASFCATLGAGAVMLAAFVATGDVLVRYLLGPEFRAAGQLVPWIALGSLSLACAYSLNLVLFGRKLTRELLFIRGLGAAAYLAMTVLLVSRWGALGAAVACAAYYGVEFLLLAGYIAWLGALGPSGQGLLAAEVRADQVKRHIARQTQARP